MYGFFLEMMVRTPNDPRGMIGRGIRYMVRRVNNKDKAKEVVISLSSSDGFFYCFFVNVFFIGFFVRKTFPIGISVVLHMLLIFVQIHNKLIETTYY